MPQQVDSARTISLSSLSPSWVGRKVRFPARFALSELCLITRWQTSIHQNHDVWRTITDSSRCDRSLFDIGRYSSMFGPSTCSTPFLARPSNFGHDYWIHWNRCGQYGLDLSHPFDFIMTWPEYFCIRRLPLPLNYVITNPCFSILHWYVER